MKQPSAERGVTPRAKEAVSLYGLSTQDVERRGDEGDREGGAKGWTDVHQWTGQCKRRARSAASGLTTVRRQSPTCGWTPGFSA